MSLYRPQLLSLYKIALKYIKHIPKQSEKDAVLTEIRSSFKEMKAQKEKEEIESFLTQIEGRVNYIKMLIPRMIVREIEKNPAVRSYVYKDGKLVEGNATKKERTPFIDKRLDAEQMARHQYLLRRQHFMR